MEEDWEILELTGPYTSIASHSPSSGLIYSLGTVIVVWDVLSDKKINLRCHTSPVSSLSFSTDNEYFISVELSPQPLICLWRWRNLEQLSAKWLPFKPRSCNIASIHSAFSHKKVLVAETESEGGYRISVWDVVDNSLNIKLAEELELNEACLGLVIMNDLLQFACLERNCLKLWSIDSCTINKRFHFRTPVLCFEYCRSQSLFALLLESNSVLLMNQQGKTIALLSHSSYLLTSIACSNDYVYVGSKEGAVLIYNARTCTLFKELPATHSCPISRVRVNSGSLVYVVFDDATVQVLNLAEGQVSNQSSGHSLPLTSAAWADRLNFYSSSQESCLYVWRYVGKGWNMQAMDVSAGKGDITALAVHPSHRLLAVGFSKGCIKLFQTGDKPKFSQLVQFDNTAVKVLAYSHCGQFLSVLHESGACFVLNSKQEVVAELEHTRSRPNLLLALHQNYSSHGLHLLAGTCKEDYLVNLQIFKCMKDQIEKLDEKAMEIEGNCTGLAFHPSGNYLICASDAGGIYLFSVENGDTVGVILTERNVRGCFVDPSGLYVAVLAETSVEMYCKIIVYETGTGRKASEVGRLDNVSKDAVKWSGDGRYLIVGGLSGILAVWRVPKAMINTVHDMLASMQSNPFIWQEYPIELENKQIKGTGQSKKPKEVIVVPEDIKRERGAFVDSVVVLVNRPERPKERGSSKPPRVSKIHVPEPEFYKPNTRSETPLSMNKEYRSAPKYSVNDFYYKKRDHSATQHHANNFPVVGNSSGGHLMSSHGSKKSPLIVKSTLVGSSRSVESIDVECNGPSHNPAHRLYEKIDSYHSEDSESRFH